MLILSLLAGKFVVDSRGGAFVNRGALNEASGDVGADLDDCIELLIFDGDVFSCICGD